LLIFAILVFAALPATVRLDSDDAEDEKPTQATPRAVVSERMTVLPPFKNKVRAGVSQCQATARNKQPGDLLGVVTDSIDAMTSEEVVAALTQFTGRDREAIEELGDPHGFSKSLAQAVLSGWMTESDLDADTSIQFSTRLNGEDAHPDEQVFASSATRIFGSFPLQSGEQRTLLAKWYQVETSEMLLLQELPVREQDGQGFIRLDRSEGWPAGSYRLELYDPTETVTPFAMGEYQTQGHARPLTVTFR
jgi:hypothetical protein